MSGYTLILGSRNYSSWSMRAWLAMKHLGLSFDEATVELYTPEARGQVRSLGGPTGLVPTLLGPDGAVWDSLAIIEYLHERHGGLWPLDRAARAAARSLSAEMHSGFTGIRTAMPCNTRARGLALTRTPALDAEIGRITEIWARNAGGWLFGEFGAADIMFAPVATRFQTYGVELTGFALAWQQAVLSHPAVAQWLADGVADPAFFPASERPKA